MRKLIGSIAIITTIMIVGGCLFSAGTMMGNFDAPAASIENNSILELKLEGVIIDVTQFLEDLKKYTKKKEIKGVLLHINSPGGAVGPSQELFLEIKRVQDELQKPVVATVSSLAASGGYYAALGASKLVVNSGSLIGSIGVIMNFANMEKLYEWAKIHPFSINTGKYKDSGAAHRPMREDERALFQELVDEVHYQFKSAVQKARNLSVDVVDKYGDGRVFTGETAVKLGFADKVGTREDALRLLAELAGLEGDPKVFSPKKKRSLILNYLEDVDSKFSLESPLQPVLDIFKLNTQPLYLMPGTI